MRIQENTRPPDLLGTTHMFNVNYIVQCTNFVLYNVYVVRSVRPYQQINFTLIVYCHRLVSVIFALGTTWGGTDHCDMMLKRDRGGGRDHCDMMLKKNRGIPIS